MSTEQDNGGDASASGAAASNTDVPEGGENVLSTPVVLVIDPVAEDRAVLRALIEAGDRNVAVVRADSVAAGAEVVADLESLALFIIAVDPQAAGEAFDFRDTLTDKFGAPVPGAFCSASDLSAHLPRVNGELVFYKPVDDDVMSDWLDEQLGSPPQVNSDAAEPQPDEPSTTVTGDLDDNLTESDLDDDDELLAATSEALDPDILPEGTELGDYCILRVLRSDDNAAIYVAEQRSVGRKVALKALHHRHRADPERVGAFVDEARSRALVNHADVALVYEADQQNSITYYAIELMSGPNLEYLAKEKQAIDEDTLYDVLGSVSDVLAYLKESNLAVNPVRASMIHLPDAESCRVANPVAGSGPFILDETEQMRILGAAVLPFLTRGSYLTPVVQRMGIAGRNDAILSIDQLSDALDALEATADVEPETPKQVERRADRRSMMVGGIIGGLIVIAGLCFVIFSQNGGDPSKVSSVYMMPVPSGPFVYQEDETVELPQFWIDEYEITIGQYADFLAAVEADEKLLKKVQHKDQPGSKTTHRPPDWDRYYPAAQRSFSFGGADISLDCPVIQVDWWDAHAYATWRGGRLPTEQEWEKAARSRSGNLFPWGNELDTTRFNTGVDQKEEDDIKAGGVDGYQYWNPVGAIDGDESTYGVRGMAGNVSEWTGSWETDPDFPDRQVPIIRGASFSSQDNFDLKRRVPADSPNAASLATGFRTVRDTPPPKVAEPEEKEKEKEKLPSDSAEVDDANADEQG